MSCIRREIPAYGHFPHGGAVQADGITSANMVGYNTTTVVADQFYMIGVQLADVAGDGTSAEFNSFLSTTCVPGTYGDGNDVTMGNAPMIQVLTSDGKGYSYYYYINDADDGSGNYVATEWVDAQGYNLTAEAAQELSKGFWFKSATAGTLTCAGQVLSVDTFQRTVPAGQFEIVANPYPVALALNTPTTSGFTPGTYGDGNDVTMNNAPMIQVLSADGKGYAYYYYINDADDGAGNYTATEWVDGQGYNLTGTQVPAGQAFWIKSATAGTFTFDL